jgi:hypothetical protein
MIRWLDRLRARSMRDTFRLAGATIAYPYYFHPHNCGMPGDRRRTERTVELALADVWLRRAHDPWEIGAVTPYYWPGRCRVVIDPADPHPAVTVRRSLLDVDLRGHDVLCISTVEHVGEARYGLAEQATPTAALEKILREGEGLLVTFPLGCKRPLDDLALGGGLDATCRVRFVVRGHDECWRPTVGETARQPYGTGWDPALGHEPWANSVAIVDRGGYLE